MNEKEIKEILLDATNNALIYGTGFVKVSHEKGELVVGIVPIEDYKYLRINKDGLAEHVEVNYEQS